MHTPEGVNAPAPTNSQASGAEESEVAVHTPMEATEMLRFMMANMPLRSEVATKEDLKACATKADIAAIRSEMATKEDIKTIRSDMAKLGQDLRDHTTRECTKVRGDFTGALRKEDEKVDELVSAVERGGVIEFAEAKRIRHLGPFQKLA